MIADDTLEELRLQAAIMSTGGQKSAESWAQVADALKELQERREKDKQETTT